MLENRTDIGSYYFTPLSLEGHRFLQFHLLSPENFQIEGIGFFNDLDFLLEASSAMQGRFNVSLSDLALPKGQSPSGNCFNRFDRLLKISPPGLVPHSFSVLFLFKDPMLKEIENLKALEAFELTSKLVGKILGRLKVSDYGLEFFGQGISARFHHRMLVDELQNNSAALQNLAEAISKALEAEMYPEESRRLLAAMPKANLYASPFSGLTWIPSNNRLTPSTVLFLGDLSESSDTSLLEIFINAKQNQPHHAKDAQFLGGLVAGLSQTWTGTEDIPLASAKELSSGSSSPVSSNKTEAKLEGYNQEALHFLSLQRSRNWGWAPLSNELNSRFGWLACGDLLVVESPPKALELAFQFLLQACELACQQRPIELFIFTKKRRKGEMLLSALTRLFGQRPLPYVGTEDAFPDLNELVHTYNQYWSIPPKIILNESQDGLDEIRKQLEHEALQQSNNRQYRPILALVDNILDYVPTALSQWTGSLGAFKHGLLQCNASCAFAMPPELRVHRPLEWASLSAASDISCEMHFSKNQSNAREKRNQSEVTVLSLEATWIHKRSGAELNSTYHYFGDVLRFEESAHN